MITDHTPATLRAFEAEIADHFNAGHIRAPIHLSGGNEEALIEIFRAVQRHDWVLSTWRSHYHALLKGVPVAQIRGAIMDGRSITLCFPQHRFLTSAIVGGMLPVAVGLAWSINKRFHPVGEMPKVWVFVGDMAARTGAFTECTRYALAHDLPIRFVVEDNGLSVCTETKAVWGNLPDNFLGRIVTYSYKLPYPHSGAGKRVNF